MSPDIPHAGGILQVQVNPDGSIGLIKHHAPPEFPYYVTALTQTPDQTLWIGSTQVFAYEKASPGVLPLSPLSGENSVAITLDLDQ